MNDIHAGGKATNKKRGKRMKNFNRVLAAAVAVPVALGQVLAISASAFNGAVTEVTTADVKYVNRTSISRLAWTRTQLQSHSLRNPTGTKS